MVPLLGLLLVVGCNGDPTDSFRNGPSRIEATPSQLFIELNQTKSVEVGAVDDQGNPLSFDYQVTNVGAGISVSRDSSFLPVFVNDSTLGVPAEAPVFRFKVTAGAYGATSFTVSAGGVDQVIPVQVTPVVGLAATFTPSATPALGDTITITAPAGVTFTQTAALTLPGAPDSLNPLIVDRDPNGTFIRFLAPPNVNAPVTVTEVVSTSAPTLVLHPATTTLLQTPLIDSVDVTYSTATPTLGQTVTTTIQNPLIKFNPNVASTGLVRFGINFAGQLAGPLLGPDTTHLRLGSGPQAVVVAADSGSLTFQAPPNAAGVATVVSFVFPGGFSLALPTRQAITAENIGTTLNATFSDSTPGIGDPTTMTAPAGFKFAPVESLTVTVAGVPAVVGSVAAGGGSAVITPAPGTSGTAEVVGIHPTAATQFTLTMSTVHTVTVPPVPALAGTDDPTTAPSVTVPAVGGSSTFFDAGSFTGADVTGDGGLAVAQYYKIDMPAAGNLTVTTDWPNDADVDQIVCDDVGGVLDPNTCQFDAATGAQPETATYALSAGTHYIVAVLFDGSAPGFVKITLDR